MKIALLKLLKDTTCQDLIECAMLAGFLEISAAAIMKLTQNSTNELFTGMPRIDENRLIHFHPKASQLCSQSCGI